MERQYTGLDAARKLIDSIIKNINSEEDKRGAYVHLYGVGLMASLLALKRDIAVKLLRWRRLQVCFTICLHIIITAISTKRDFGLMK